MTEEIGIETKTTSEIEQLHMVMRQNHWDDYDIKKWVSLEDHNKALKAKDKETKEKIKLLEQEIVSKDKIIESFKVFEI